jgi:hypothetical protein
MGLDRMDQAAIFFVIKYAVLVRTCLNEKPAVFFQTKLSDNRCLIHLQDSRNLLDLFFLYEDAAFTVATISAHLTLKRLHHFPEIKFSLSHLPFQ